MSRSEWTLNSLHDLIVQLLAERDRHLDERMAHQHTLLTTLAAERQMAVDRADAAQRKEWHEHLEQARRESEGARWAQDKYVAECDRRTALQFDASEKAVAAAFAAAEKAVEVRASSL